MATTFSPNAFTFTTPVAAASFSSAAAPNTTQTLDLTTKFGAWLYCRIGRTVATALTRSAFFAIRRQCNGTLIHPASAYDFVSSTAAVNATTLNGAANAGTTTATLTTATGFAAGQVVCLSSGSSRIEFAGTTDLTSTTLTIDRSGGWRVGHNSGDTITWGADVGTIWLPGGDVWEITPVNNSGQALIMACDAAVYASDTGV